MSQAAMEVPRRAGERPATTRPTSALPRPHEQVSQTAPIELQEELFRRAAALPWVSVGPSKVSVPGARAFHLDPAQARGPSEAFQRATEFAHLHPPHDGSMHLTLPPDVYEQVLAAGWGEPHPLGGTMLLFGPRDDEELEVVWGLLRTSYEWAVGGS